MILYLHIGLPKTATTFWQKRVFPRLDGVALVQRKAAPEEEFGIIRPMMHLAHDRPLASRRAREAVTGRLSALMERVERSGGERVLVSHENLSITSDGFWNGRSAPPGRVIGRLVRLGEELGLPQVRVLLGTRAVEDWLPSRYAESAKLSRYAHFGQPDFDRRVARLTGWRPLPAPARWLRFAAVEQALGDAFGAGNVLAMPMERLEATPEQAVAEVAGFLTGAPVDPARFGTLEAANRLREAGTWHLKGRPGRIGISAAQVAAIRARFG